MINLLYCWKMYRVVMMSIQRILQILNIILTGSNMTNVPQIFKKMRYKKVCEIFYGYNICNVIIYLCLYDFIWTNTVCSENFPLVIPVYISVIYVHLFSDSYCNYRWGRVQQIYLKLYSQLFPKVMADFLDFYWVYIHKHINWNFFPLCRKMY